MCVVGGRVEEGCKINTVTNEPSQTTLEQCGLRNQQIFPNEIPFSSCEPPAENSMRVHVSLKFK